MSSYLLLCIKKWPMTRANRIFNVLNHGWTGADLRHFTRTYHTTIPELSIALTTNYSVNEISPGIIDTSNAFFENLFREDDDICTTSVTKSKASLKKLPATNVTIKVILADTTLKAKVSEKQLLVYNAKAKTWEKVSGQCKVVYSTGEVYEGLMKDGLREGIGSCIYPDRCTKAASKRHINGADSNVATSGALSFDSPVSPLSITSPPVAIPTTVGGTQLGNTQAPIQKQSSTSDRVYTYTGMYHNGYRHGHGIMVYPNGDTYKGNWERDHRQGPGTLTAITGETITGVYRNDKLHSGKGSVVLKDGEICSGTWTNGMMNGPGTAIHPDGTTYTGDFVDNYPHCVGRMVYTSGDIYEGQFVRRKRHGQGVLSYANGDKYEGCFENGKRHGQGKHASGPHGMHILEGEFRNGVIYNGTGSVLGSRENLFEGEWKEGIFYGHYSDSRGSSVTGDFRNNKIWSGAGTLIEDEITYEGTWVEGKRTGQGKLTVAGHVLVGEFKDDRIYTGEGVMVYPDCSTYIGTWVKGKREGQGVFTNVMGQTMTGRFKNDSMYTGSGVYVQPDGVVYEGAWIMGKKCGHGIFTYIDGTVKQGEVRDDSIYRGISTLSIGTAVLTHVIANGKPSGEWRIAYADGTSRNGSTAAELHNINSTVLNPNGDIYEGYFVNNKLHGQGKITNVYQQVFEGEFKKGMIWNGAGVLRNAIGAVYEGSFVDGQRHGQGKFTCERGYTVSGEFKDNKLYNGCGSKLMLSGDLYEGSWVNGKFHGAGKITYANGSVLEGEFRENCIYQGKGTSVGKTVFEGEWVDGKLHGPGKIVFANGFVLSGTFKNGVLCPVIRG